jgi:hypothetical protein
MTSATVAIMSDDPLFGYKRPPVHTRFVAGRSGNPKGRPKGTRNLETDLREELAEQIPIREGERSLRVSKQRALLKALLAKALKGDTRAAAIVLQLVAKVIAPEEAEAASPSDEVTGDDLAILERFLARRNATRK